MKPNRVKSRIGLSLVFSLVVFVIFLITAAIISLLVWAAVNAGVIERAGRPGITLSVILLLVVSVIVGTVISLVIGHIPLRPVRRIITAMNRLSDGDFSARLDVRHPPEFAELSDSFNRMAYELGGIEMLRTDFVNNFSHEFKTPIVSIKGFAELLKRDDLSKEERDEYLDIVIRESGRLSVLATNVLNLSKVENQSILADIKEFDMSEQLRRCILMIAPKWEQKNIAIEVDIEDVCYCGDEELLSQVWLNLVDNAVKFSPKDGHIAVSLRNMEDKVVVSVANDGEIVNEETAEHIFDKFYQGDTSHAAAGNGLGLTLVKRIVELHGGTVRLERLPQTVFVTELPLIKNK